MGPTIFSNSLWGIGVCVCVFTRMLPYPHLLKL